MNKFILVGLGGALGAMLRYGMTYIPFKSHFPISTFFTNIIGAIFIGFIVGIFEKQRIGESFMLFLKTGVCGGFTTFSTFSLETLQLIENGHILMGTIYIITSVIGCIFGVFIGKYIGLK